MKDNQCDYCEIRLPRIEMVHDRLLEPLARWNPQTRILLAHEEFMTMSERRPMIFRMIILFGWEIPKVVTIVGRVRQCYVSGSTSYQRLGFAMRTGLSLARDNLGHRPEPVNHHHADKMPDVRNQITGEQRKFLDRKFALTVQSPCPACPGSSSLARPENPKART